MSGATEWLAADPKVERLELDEGQLGRRRARTGASGDEVHDGLLAGAGWEQGQVFRYERWIDSPRLMAAYPAGTQPAIDEVDTWLRRHYRVRFGSPALALYRDERDSVAFHRDRELRWLDDTVIAVLTFGEAAVADEAAERPALRPRRRCRRDRLPRRRAATCW